ncbi:DUF2521 family protein [Bacillus sp. N9]
MTKARSREELSHFIDTLHHFWLYLDFEQRTIDEETIYSSCEKFVNYWWLEGYKKGARLYKLRLH